MTVEERAHRSIERVTESWYRKPKWWREIIFIGVLYGLYSLVRNLHGSRLSVSQADAHATNVVNAEKWLHIFNEKSIQDVFLDHTWAVKGLNVWYGSMHFIVTIGVLLWLFHIRTDRYHKWRNVLFGTTFFAMVGYVVYPLAPPRLLPESFGFVDTLQTVGGLWDFDSETVKNASNQYAAMPSLHVGWALWCALAIIPVLKHWWTRALIAIYPAITIIAIVATANHYWMDVFGGALVFALGYVLAEWINQRDIRLHRRLSEADTDIAHIRHPGERRDPVGTDAKRNHWVLDRSAEASVQDDVKSE